MTSFYTIMKAEEWGLKEDDQGNFFYPQTTESKKEDKVMMYMIGVQTDDEIARKEANTRTDIKWAQDERSATITITEPDDGQATIVHLQFSGDVLFNLNADPIPEDLRRGFTLAQQLVQRGAQFYNPDASTPAVIISSLHTGVIQRAQSAGPEGKLRNLSNEEILLLNRNLGKIKSQVPDYLR